MRAASTTVITRGAGEDSAPFDCSKEAVIRVLYERMGRAAMSKTIRIVGRAEVACELVHDVFLRLWQSKIAFPTERAVYAWIFRACHNAAINHVRAAPVRRESARGDEIDQSDEDDPAGAAPACPVSQRFIRQALEVLSATEADAFVHKVLDGMTQEEIAEHLQCSRKTVQRLLASVEAKLDGIRKLHDH